MKKLNTVKEHKEDGREEGKCHRLRAMKVEKDTANDTCHLFVCYFSLKTPSLALRNEH